MEMSEEDQREEEAFNLINIVVDSAMTLISEYGWTKQDVLDSLDASL